MRRKQSMIVAGYAQMWPRQIFDIREGKNRLLPDLVKLFNRPGVYILYRDGQPYYIGKASRSILHRIWSHANQPKNRHYPFWNYFSVFVIPEKKYIADVEGMLIAGALTSGNNARPRFPWFELPKKVANVMKAQRKIPT